MFDVILNKIGITLHRKLYSKEQFLKLSGIFWLSWKVSFNKNYYVGELLFHTSLINIWVQDSLTWTLLLDLPKSFTLPVSSNRILCSSHPSWLKREGWECRGVKSLTSPNLSATVAYASMATITHWAHPHSHSLSPRYIHCEFIIIQLMLILWSYITACF